MSLANKHIDLPYLQKWVGQHAARTERITPFPANALAATLDRDDMLLGDGDVLPPLYHWLYFRPMHRLDQSNYDGHARLGNFLPPVPLPRRMWAGSRLRFAKPLRVGAQLRKESTVQAVSHKAGRSGDLVFVTVRNRVFDGRVLGVEDEHDIVYRRPPRPDDPVPKLSPAPSDSDFSRQIRPDPVLLFRYSALTFNGHRIHYDRRFCVEDEGYEGLVVHGPLLATLLIDLVRRQFPQAGVEGFSFRALAPVFDTHDFTIHGQRLDGGRLRLWVRRHDGAMAMDAEAAIQA